VCVEKDDELGESEPPGMLLSVFRGMMAVRSVGSGAIVIVCWRIIVFFESDRMIENGKMKLTGDSRNSFP